MAKDCYASGRRLYKHLCPLAFGRINFKGGARLLPTAKAGGFRRAYLMKRKKVLTNVVFFGDYDSVCISEDNDQYAVLVANLVKKKFIPSSSQEISMQVNVTPNGKQINEIPERKTVFRPVFLLNTVQHKRSITIKADRLDIIDENCSDLEKLILEVSEYVKAFEEAYGIRHNRMAINVRFQLLDKDKINEELIRKAFCPAFLSDRVQNKALTAWYTQFVHTRNIKFNEDKNVTVNIAIAIEESVINKSPAFWCHIDVNTDARNTSSLFSSQDIKLLTPIVLKEKKTILEAINNDDNK